MNINQAAKLAKMATGKNLPVYENIMIESSSNGSNISAMNGSIHISINCDDLSGIDCAVDASKFLAALSKYKNPVFENKNDQIVIKEGRSRATIPAVSLDEMPSFTGDVNSKQTNTAILMAVQDVSFAAGDNDVRQYLNGVCIQSDGNTSTAIATNGHMMAFASVGPSDAENFSVIIPNSALSILSSVEPMDVYVGNKVTVKSLDSVITVNLIDGKFPEWRRVVPSNSQRLEVNREELIDALGKVSVVSSDKMQSGIMSITKDSLTITSSHPDSSEAQAMIDCSSTSDIDIGVNIRYLSAAANAIKTSNIVIEYGKATDALLFKDDYLSVVVMPMRV